jgi:SPOR domain
MSMADEQSVRSYRSNDAQRSSASGASAKSGDPLADLARLIGQSDPFADFGQRTARSSERVATAAPSPQSDWRKTAAAMRPYDPEPQSQPQPASLREALASLPNSDFPAQPTGYNGTGGYNGTAGYNGANGHEPLANGRAYANGDGRGYAPAQPRYAQPQTDPVEEDDGYAAAAPEAREGELYCDDGAPMTPQDEQAYDDVPRARRRSGLFTAVTLIACAMVGTAGAYGYRTYYTGPGGPRTPPVIPAEASPAKIVPNDSQAGKVITDRVGENQGERLMPGAEQPVDLKAPSNPRVVLPPPVQPLTNQTSPPPQGAPAQANPAPVAPGGEPKRIRTVTIRSDGSDASGRTIGNGQANPGRTGSTARTQAPPPPAARTGTGPISLDPQAPAYTAPPTAPPAPVRERSASVMPLTPPAPRADGPSAVPPRASAPGGSGGYMVQLSSQRSEAEAHASFRSMQARYPNQLGGRSATVRRADLGSKGTFYRAMVGPFASSSEADQFCSGLKSAGGQCIIQRN